MGIIDSAIAKMNASPDCFMVIYRQIPGAKYLDLMRTEGDVHYDGHSIYNLKGIRLQKDHDIKNTLPPESVGPGGYPLEQSDLDGNKYCSTEIVVGDEETIINYLKETNNWDDGMILGKDDRWTKLLGAVDLCFPPV